jgi:O-antigen/teichoic acid export membrane protein
MINMASNVPVKEVTPPSGLAAVARAWLWRNRTSTRLSFLLRTVCMLIGAALGLIWARWLNRLMGKETYGIFLNFLVVAQLGGLGDLGISGAVGIRMLQHLARGEEEAGRRFLANARGVFAGLSLLVLAGFMLLSPWLPGWCSLTPTAQSGSLTLLFMLGGFSAAVLIVNGYFQNLNAVHGNMLWPVLPAFILTQLGLVGQYLLAVRGAPLWEQYAALLAMAILSAALGVCFLKISHPWLGNLRPVRFDWGEMRALVSSSFYVYLCVLGNMVYVSTDQLLVGVGFGQQQVPAYRFNYKLCEMTFLLLSSACFVALPAIVRRLLSVHAAERAQGVDGLERLQKLQAFAACTFAIGYLCVNEHFITLWQGAEYHLPLLLQTMFALNLAITSSGETALQVRGRYDMAGLRLFGLTAAGAGLLNLALSLIAVKAGYMVGIAAATVVAQSVFNFIMSRSTCRLLNLSWRVWIFRGWVLPMAVVGVCALLRRQIPPETIPGALGLGTCCLLLVCGLAFALDIRPRLVMDEWRRLRASIG